MKLKGCIQDVCVMTMAVYRPTGVRNRSTFEPCERAHTHTHTHTHIHTHTHTHTHTLVAR
jgi:hypothetical protein